LEQAGEPLQLDFKKNRFGPYSEKLRHALRALDGHYISGLGDNSGESEIVLVPGAIAEADKFLESTNGVETSVRVARVQKLIDGFESPYGMELLATVHWSMTHDPRPSSVAELVTKVHAWSDHKRRSLQSHHISIAMRRLHELGWS
jgi:hypothetical protein